MDVVVAEHCSNAWALKIDAIRRKVRWVNQ